VPRDSGVVFASDGGDATTGTDPAAAFCGSCREEPAGGPMRNASILEASGLAASMIHPGVFYLQNDSGDSARFFATNPAGADLSEIAVKEATATDWEDIAVGPCPSGSCVYLADIGDNKQARKSYAVYRVPEPSELTQGVQLAAAEALPFVYPDGSHNAETLLVHPETGVITIVTKTGASPSGIYEMPMPLTPGITATLQKRGELLARGASPLFTGGDIGARGVLLRTYSDVLFFPLAKGQAVFEALQQNPCMAPAPVEAKGEAVGWLANGLGYATISEGASASIHVVTCAR
jgi:hypothetical protein